jgi:hypothetical protein
MSRTWLSVVTLVSIGLLSWAQTSALGQFSPIEALRVDVWTSDISKAGTNAQIYLIVHVLHGWGGAQASVGWSYALPGMWWNENERGSHET